MQAVTDLEILRLMAAPPARVWRCLTEPALLRQWWAPHPVITSHAEIQPFAGGRFHAVMEIPDRGPQVLDLCILEAQPHHRLVWTDMMRAGFRPVETPIFGFVAVVTLTPEGAGTRYHVVAMHRSAVVAAHHREIGFQDGWGTCAAQLDALSQGL